MNKQQILSHSEHPLSDQDIEQQVSSLYQIAGQLTWKTYQLRYRFLDNGYLYKSKSESWRGMLGHLLRDHARQLYRDIFACKVSPHHPLARKYNTPPNPYIVWVPDHNRTYAKAGETIDVHLTLIGKVSALFPDLLQLLLDMKDLGFRHDGSNTRIRLLSYKSRNPRAQVIPADQLSLNCLVELQSPLIFKKEDCKGGSIPAHKWFERLAERICLLGHFHQDLPLWEGGKVFQHLCRESHAIGQGLKQLPYQRRSNRTGRLKQITAYTGNLVYAGLDARLVLLLELGKHLHSGKSCVQGCGKFDYQLW